MDEIIEKIEDLGYDDFFELSRMHLGLEKCDCARVIAEFKGAYKIKNVDGEYTAKIRGKKVYHASSREDFPAVGDWVTINRLDDRQAIVRDIFPRKTVMKRKRSGKDDVQMIAANVDVAFIVESVDRDFNVNRFERYVALAHDGGIQTAIIVNKVDVISSEDLAKKVSQVKERFKNTKIFLTSTVIGEGVSELKNFIEKGKTYCFLGSSGVGKSSLINCLIGKEDVKTGGIGQRSHRGKHTTTAREMYFLHSGGIVIDNPGMREIGMVDANSGINDAFDHIASLATGCKFTDCTHMHEPGCEVLAAKKSGAVNEDQYDHYVKLKKESAYYDMTTAAKREKSRKFGKFLKKAKKSIKKYK